MNVKFLRESNNLSKKEMARILGVGVETLRKLENGVLPKTLKAKVVINIYDFFGVLPNEIFEEALR